MTPDLTSMIRRGRVSSAYSTAEPTRRRVPRSTLRRAAQAQIAPVHATPGRSAGARVTARRAQQARICNGRILASDRVKVGHQGLVVVA